MDHAYWGTAIRRLGDQRFLKSNNIPYTLIENEDKLLDQVVERI